HPRGRRPRGGAGSGSGVRACASVIRTRRAAAGVGADGDPDGVVRRQHAHEPAAQVAVDGERAVAAHFERTEDSHLDHRASLELYLPATEETYFATAWICAGVSLPLKDGIAPLPFVTRSTTRPWGGLAWSRLGPTVPFEPASLSVWHPVQP